MTRSLMLFALLFGSLGASAQEAQLERADEAIRVLTEIMQSPDRRIPNEMFAQAEAIAVIPNVVKAGLVLGGRHGRGLISVRSADGTWSNPSYVSLAGGSVGFQAGVQATDVVLVFRSRRGVDSIVNGKFTLGADAAVAAGPVGRNAQALTDGELKAEIYSYSRSRGLFAGVALDGSVIKIDHKSNQKIYGSKMTPRRIFEGGVGRVPERVVDFRDRLEEHTAQ